MTGRLAILAGDGGLVADAIGAAHDKGYEVGLFLVTDRSDITGDVTQRVDPARPLAMVWRVRAFRPEKICLVGSVSLTDRHRSGLQRVMSWFGGRRGGSESGDGSLARGLPILERMTGGKVLGVHELIDGLAVGEGHIAGPQPDAGQWALCDYALANARKAGSLDLGQAAVCTSGRVVAVEDVGGTDALIDRVQHLRQQGLVDVPSSQLALAKARKPDQPAGVDLPTIGAETLRNAAKAGIGLICLHADNALLADRSEVCELAETLGITVLAARPGI